MSKGSAPATPDYAAAAQQTAAGNLQAAQAAAAANRVNQVTPYGNLTYSDNGNDSTGNPTYTATQTLAPGQQQLLDQTNQLNSGLLNTAQGGLDYANQTLAKPGVNLNGLPSTGINPGQTYSAAMMQQLQPQIDRQNEMLDSQLANQGITQGSEAWKNAKTQQASNENNLLAQATTSGIGVGLNANNQAFNQQAYNQMQPINVINALRTGTQVSNPNLINAPQQATTTGADLLGASQATYNSNLANYNAKVAQGNGLLGSATQLGVAGLTKYSDRRLKKNIVRIGTHKRGIGIYKYDYIWDEPAIGVMADEVMTVMPSAVIHTSLGYDMVNYGALNG